jgi:hypothetical protein
MKCCTQAKLALAAGGVPRLERVGDLLEEDEPQHDVLVVGRL